MFTKIYRAMVIKRVGSAASQVVCNMTNRQLADAGIDRWTFPLDAMKRMEAEFAEKDAKKIQALSSQSTPDHALQRDNRKCPTLGSTLSGGGIVS